MLCGLESTGTSLRARNPGTDDVAHRGHVTRLGRRCWLAIAMLCTLLPSAGCFRQSGQFTQCPNCGHLKLPIHNQPCPCPPIGPMVKPQSFGYQGTYRRPWSENLVSFPMEFAQPVEIVRPFDQIPESPRVETQQSVRANRYASSTPETSSVDTRDVRVEMTPRTVRAIPVSDRRPSAAAQTVQRPTTAPRTAVATKPVSVEPLPLRESPLRQSHEEQAEKDRPAVASPKTALPPPTPVFVIEPKVQSDPVPRPIKNHGTGATSMAAGPSESENTPEEPSTLRFLTPAESPLPRAEEPLPRDKAPSPRAAEPLLRGMEPMSRNKEPEVKVPKGRGARLTPVRVRLAQYPRRASVPPAIKVAAMPVRPSSEQ